MIGRALFGLNDLSLQMRIALWLSNLASRSSAVAFIGGWIRLWWLCDVVFVIIAIIIILLIAVVS